MSPPPPPPPSPSSASLQRYGAGLEAELQALRRASDRGVRLTATDLDSIGAVASGLPPPAFHRLERETSEFLQHHDRGPVDSTLVPRLDSLRSELLVWRVRAGP